MRRLGLLLVISALTFINLHADNTINMRADKVITSSITTTAPRLVITTDTYTTGYSSATTFYGDGSNLTGVIIINGISYVEIYTFDNTLFSTQTASVPNFLPIEAYNWFTDEINGFTVNGSSITYSGNGGAGRVFLVTVSISAYSNTNNSETHWRLFLNGVQHDPIHIERFMANLNDVGAIPLSGLITLSTGDILQMRASSNKAINLVVQHMGISITEIN